MKCITQAFILVFCGPSVISIPRVFRFAFQGIFLSLKTRFGNRRVLKTQVKAGCFLGCDPATSCMADNGGPTISDEVQATLSFLRVYCTPVTMLMKDGRPRCPCLHGDSDICRVLSMQKKRSIQSDTSFDMGRAVCRGLTQLREGVFRPEWREREVGQVARLLWGK